MKNYFPFPFFADDAPIDISFVFASERPAGKHGFLQVSGRSFCFEDGTAVKFWGTNFNGAGCFPEHDYAEKLSKRLAKLGINLVRFHQLDAEWHTPNIFSFTKGKRVTQGHLDSESMERLDYLIHCLKKEGIYVYLDMLTYRRFRSDEGVEAARMLRDSAKPYSIFSRRLIELQKQFCTEIWTHYNPYTQLKYCDDPVIVLSEITNECDLFTDHGGVKKTGYIEPYKSEFRAYFNEWLKEKGIDRRAEDIFEMDAEDRDLLAFKGALHERYYAQMTAHMRSLGVKIPIAGTNWNVPPAGYPSQVCCDFIDTHSYFYDWRWGELEKRCTNKGITEEKNSYLGTCGYLTHKDKPTYISEWDMPWPNERRAESVLYSAALGAFQGWSGFAIHTYSYSTKLDGMKILGEEVTAPKIGGTPYRQGVFCAWNDPAKFGLFYHAALITRRGDVSEGKTTYGIDAPDPTDWDRAAVATNIERYKFVTSPGMGDGLPALPADTGEGFICSDTGELYRSLDKNLGIIDTDRTKCAYGSLCKNGEITLRGLKIKCDTDYAVIAMSSLTDAPITASDNILLTTVGRAENTDAKFSGELMLDIGKPPVLVESIEAELSLETAYCDLEVFAVSAEGYYIGKLPSEYRDGRIRFTLGRESKSMYYLIVRP
ncbi:MAG: hypothetical protein J6J66_03900 [Clostridia bacterium]|nr:hypothetical protein [Clostridia bacterium]